MFSVTGEKKWGLRSEHVLSLWDCPSVLGLDCLITPLDSKAVLAKGCHDLVPRCIQPPKEYPEAWLPLSVHAVEY